MNMSWLLSIWICKHVNRYFTYKVFATNLSNRLWSIDLDSGPAYRGHLHQPSGVWLILLHYSASAIYSNRMKCLLCVHVAV